MRFSLEIDEEPDAHGVHDGINLAAVLIRQAYLHLAFYTGGCHGCADKLFQHVADFAIEHVWNEPGPLNGQISGVPGTGPDQVEAHFNANVERVRRMIGTPEHRH